MDNVFRTSGFCGAGNCVEIAYHTSEQVLIRDVGRAVLRIGSAETWQSLLTCVKADSLRPGQ